MTRSSGFKVGMGIAIAALAGSQKAAAQAPTLSVDPSRLPRLGTVDARFQSNNLEMVEVTGGRFWKPYRASASAPSARDADNSGNIPAGANPDALDAALHASRAGFWRSIPAALPRA